MQRVLKRLAALENARVRVKKKVQRLKSVEYALKMKKQSVVEGYSPDGEDRLLQEEASRLYWDEDIPVKLLVAAMGFEGDEARKMRYHKTFLIPKTVEMACYKCGSKWDEAAYSKTKLAELNNKARGSVLYCQACMEWSAGEYKRMWQESQDTIRQLRAMPYRDYLETDHWKETRKKVLRYAGYRCQMCNASGKLHVHHRTYETRGYEDYEDLSALCETCHQKFHDKLPKTEDNAVEPCEVVGC